MSTERKIFIGLVGGVGLTLTNLLMSFLQLKMLLHFISQQETGIWLLMLSLGGYVVLLDLGLGPTMGREVSFTIGNSRISMTARAEHLGTLIRTCTGLALILAVTVTILGLTVGWVYLRTTLPVAYTGTSHLAWSIFVFSTAINLVGQGWFAGIYGLGEVLTERILRSLAQVVGIAMMWIALWLKQGLTGLAVAAVVQSCFTIAMARRKLRIAGHNLFKLGTFDLEIIRRLALPSLKYAGTLLGGIVILQTDNLIIASRLGTYLIPNYQAVSKIVYALMALSSMLMVTTTPFQSQAHAQQNSAEIVRLMYRNLKFSLSIMIVFGSVLACFADKILMVWLGSGHFVGFGVVWALLAMMILEAHHQGMGLATMATGRIVFVAPALIAGALNIIFSVYLAGHYGLRGVALGTLCAQLLTNNWYVPWYTLRTFHLSLRVHLRQIVLPVLTLFTVTLVMGYGIRLLTSKWPPWIQLCAGVAGIALAGAAIVGTLLLSVEERTWLMTTIRGRFPFIHEVGEL